MRRSCLNFFLFASTLSLFLAGNGPRVEAQALATRLTKAASATELPLGAWGPYARTNSGPCYLASRVPPQLFAFPIVIGQRRSETMLRSEKTAAGTTRLRVESVVLERRALGLSPVQAEGDDRGGSVSNRRARVREADAEGFLWSMQVPFESAPLAQKVAPPVDANGQPTALAPWGAGEATVECFPAFADPDADGLLVHVTLTNRSDTPETYFVDLLGGLDTLSDAYMRKELTVQPDSENGSMLVKYAKSSVVFALSAHTHLPIRNYRVGDAYFAPGSAITRRDATGKALPGGEIPTRPGEENAVKPARADGQSETDAGTWALTRVDEIAVPPGQSVSLFLGVGVGKEDDAAVHSLHTLLGAAEDVMPEGQPVREGAYTRALAAHRTARFSSGEEALDRLAAQSLVNVPFGLLRRVGVPSRQPTQGRPGGDYQPEAGGLMALGWSAYRPDWAAAQLNAWFVTNGDLSAPLSKSQTVLPTNLLALWELYQQTQDRHMLAVFYPFARRRYQELLAAGRGGGALALYAWPDASGARSYAPDYSAYVIRSARILERLATELERAPGEIQEYTRVADEATQALNASLWDAPQGRFLPKPVADQTSAPAAPPQKAVRDSLERLLPLIAGTEALTPVQRAALLKPLADPGAFWSPYGLRSVSKASPAYRADSPGQGAISIGQNWLCWKALLDIGEADTARKLASLLIPAYHNAQGASGGCPEWLNGDTGAAGGAPDYAGNTLALLPLYAAYHTRGTVATGWDIAILADRYDREVDKMDLVFRPYSKEGKGVILCVMGKLNGKYTLSGALTGTATADANGVLTLTTPANAFLQQLNIAPAEAGQ